MSRNDDSGDPKNSPGNSVDKANELNVSETVADAIKRKPFSWQHGFLLDLVRYLISRSAVDIPCVGILVHAGLSQPHPEEIAPDGFHRSHSPASYSTISPGKRLLSAK